MNKFLAEQLLEFNKKMVDPYRENWGTILNFVHEDPNFAETGIPYDNKNNNSSIDIFQKQMRAKEEELLEKRAAKEAAAKESN